MRRKFRLNEYNIHIYDNYVYAAYLDMSEAFERVNHSLHMLLKKLQFLINTTASVFYINCFSKKWTII